MCLQRRRRFVLLASALAAVDPQTVLEGLTAPMAGHRDRTVKWAIKDLLSVDSESAFDTPSGVSEDNVARMAVLFDENRFTTLPNEHRPECHRDGDHSYVSVYGRLRWGRPAQTITTGFGSMGQGRFVHPQRRSTLTPHEAARLQTFPDWFDFGGVRRGVLATTIGNAVPPLLIGRARVCNPPQQSRLWIEPSADVRDPKTTRSFFSAGAKRMRATRQSDTAAELALRRELHAAGLRYRVNRVGYSRFATARGHPLPGSESGSVRGWVFLALLSLHRTFPQSERLLVAEKARSESAARHGR